MNGLAWAFGTFHATVVGIALLLLAYPGGSLGVLLGGLSTITGLALFIALWVATVFSTGRAIRGLRLIGHDRATSGAFYRGALRWGAANGVLFVLAAAVILALNGLVTAPETADRGVILRIAFIQGVFGSLFGLAIGAVVGLVLASLDGVALAVARSIAGPMA
jgi:hypothetical protein